MALQQGMEFVNNSKNFSRNSTDEQFTTDALLGITATICCIICLMVLVTLSVYAKCYSRSTVCGTTIKRLAVGLIIPTMLYELVVALHLVRYVKHLCELQGFLIQYTSSVALLLALSICLVLFFEVLQVNTSWKLECYEKVKWNTFTCCDRKINKLEVTMLTCAFALPLLFDWIPFTTNSYGPSQNFCWFRSIPDKNLSEHLSYTAGLWEEIWLSVVPLGFVVFLILVLFTASLCQLGYGIKNARVDRRALIEVGVTNCLFFLAFLTTAVVLLPFHGFFNTSMKVPQFTAIFTPIAMMLLPLTLLMAIHLPFSSMITRLCLKRSQCGHTSEEGEHTTVHRSSNRQQPSHTTWNPSHSYCEASEITPFVICEQQQDYGNCSRNIN